MHADHVEPSATSPRAIEPCDPPEVGAPAPNFEWIDEDGSHTQLSDLRGSPVLLAFFAAEWNPARPYQLQMYNEVLQRLPHGGRVLGLAQDGRWCEVMLDGEEVRFPLLDNLGMEDRKSVV